MRVAEREEKLHPLRDSAPPTPALDQCFHLGSKHLRDHRLIPIPTLLFLGQIPVLVRWIQEGPHAHLHDRRSGRVRLKALEQRRHGSSGRGKGQGDVIRIGLLIQLLEYKARPALYQLAEINPSLLVLPVEEKAKCGRLSERAKGPEEVTGLATFPVGAIQHSEEEPQLTGQTELLGTEVLLNGTANRLHEIQHLEIGERLEEIEKQGKSSKKFYHGC